MKNSKSDRGMAGVIDPDGVIGQTKKAKPSPAKKIVVKEDAFDFKMPVVPNANLITGIAYYVRYFPDKAKEQIKFICGLLVLSLYNSVELIARRHSKSASARNAGMDTAKLISAVMKNLKANTEIYEEMMNKCDYIFSKYDIRNTFTPEEQLELEESMDRVITNYIENAEKSAEPQWCRLMNTEASELLGNLEPLVKINAVAMAELSRYASDAIAGAIVESYKEALGKGFVSRVVLDDLRALSIVPKDKKDTGAVLSNEQMESIKTLLVHSRHRDVLGVPPEEVWRVFLKSKSHCIRGLLSLADTIYSTFELEAERDVTQRESIFFESKRNQEFEAFVASSRMTGRDIVDYILRGFRRYLRTDIPCNIYEYMIARLEAVGALDVPVVDTLDSIIDDMPKGSYRGHIGNEARVDYIESSNTKLNKKLRQYFDQCCRP